MTEIMDAILLISVEIKELRNILISLQEKQVTEQWLDGQDVRLMLKISKRTLQSLRDCGSLPFSKINGKFYYKRYDIEALLESNYTHSKSKRNGDNKSSNTK